MVPHRAAGDRFEQTAEQQPPDGLAVAGVEAHLPAGLHLHLLQVVVTEVGGNDLEVHGGRAVEPGGVSQQVTGSDAGPGQFRVRRQPAAQGLVQVEPALVQQRGHSHGGDRLRRAVHLEHGVRRHRPAQAGIAQGQLDRRPSLHPGAHLSATHPAAVLELRLEEAPGPDQGREGVSRHRNSSSVSSRTAWR